LAEPTTLPDALQAKRSSAGFQTIVSNTMAAPVALNMVLGTIPRRAGPGETFAPDREIAEIVDWYWSGEERSVIGTRNSPCPGIRRNSLTPAVP
jgi:hypothetical protein